MVFMEKRIVKDDNRLGIYYEINFLKKKKKRFFKYLFIFRMIFKILFILLIIGI